ncbi:hypothetical protein [Azospirillum thermophilum]|uniref:Baseplate protein J-like domain-containing protein n=1 Tax=Azospirillum thermophilum TaxID=2202148 RepID=A0A2S2CZE2_9PROT|nr:hypothetical protein [Azospirillum thermophilum]AWK89876.1 hypothetical protein DEW08_28050 [Azospirillum thermophilum]
MIARADMLVLNDLATSQSDRLLAAPAPRRVKVDGRTLPQLLNFAVEYGRLIRFYDLADLPDGDWSEFFSGNPGIALAMKLGLDIRNVEAEFDRLTAVLRSASSLDAQRRAADALIAAVLRLVRLVEADADSSSVESTLGAAIASRHRGQLADPARRLIAHLGGNAVEHGLRRAWSGTARGWDGELAEVLGDLAEALLSVIEQDRATDSARFQDAMQADGHAPQAALYNAFVTLFRHAQDTVNDFPSRLVRFYDEQVLRQHSRVGSPDQVYLAFSPAKGVTLTSVPKGTVFPAGTDANGTAIRYTLDQAVSVGNTAVTGLRTLGVTRTPLQPAADRSAMPPADQVLSGVAALSDQPPLIARPFPLFGAERTAPGSTLDTTTASLGFALASPTLMLTGGGRTVTLGLTFTQATLDAAIAVLEPLCDDPLDALALVLNAGFTLRYTTTGGWAPVKGYAVQPPADATGAFTLSFSLAADAAPFVAPARPPEAESTPPPPGAASDDGLPVLAGDLVQELVTVGQPPSSVTLYPYGVLSGLALSGLSIGVTVDGLTDLTLTTPNGAASASQPFPPFGSPPVQGAALDVAAQELFVKTLGHLSMRIGWYGLPVASTGFYGYYYAYVIDADGVKQPPGKLFDNRSFRASLTVVNPGLWTIGQDKTPDKTQTQSAPDYLFRTVADDRTADGTGSDDTGSGDAGAQDPAPAPQGRLVPATTLTAPALAPATPPTYYDPASSVLRLALTAPDYAFGNTLYAANTMAASVELTAAAAACAQRCSRPGLSLAAMLDSLLATVGQAPDKTVQQDVATALQSLLPQMAATGVTAAQDAISNSGAPPARQADWRSSLSAALNQPAEDKTGKRRSTAPAPDATATLGRLSAWIAGNGAALGPGAQPDLGLARTMAADGGMLAATAETAQGQPTAEARQTMAAAVQKTQADLQAAETGRANGCLERCMQGQPQNGFPNQPWLPQMASLSVSYDAASALPGDQASRYFHLMPFDEVAAVDWPPGKAVPLLAPIAAAGELRIELAEPITELALLFTLAPSRAGWPEAVPPVTWSQGTGGAWTPLTPLRDGTNGLRNSGIVTFELPDMPADAAPTAPVPGSAPKLWLRASVAADPDAFPLLADLVANAATASWSGPGGAPSLGTPLKAGTITAGADPLPGVATVAQPLPSFGGRPEATDRSFEMWMAERLRHKGFGIQSWDYARLALSEFPALWQAAVVPASDGDGTPAPGRVWVVAVPGPTTPGIADPSMPACDSATLGRIRDMLAARISPFIRLSVTSPPYQRMKVTAKLVFSDDDTAEASARRLNDELVRFLSPWPDPAPAPRPSDYYTADAVAHFIRNRPYVLGILSFDYAPDPPPKTPGWCYLTSATEHALSGETAPSPARRRLAAAEGRP